MFSIASPAGQAGCSACPCCFLVILRQGPGPLPLPLQCWADAGTSGGWAPLSPSPTPVSKPSISCHLCN